MEQLGKIDTQLTLWLSALFPHTLLFDSFFSFFSLIGDSVFLWLFIITILIIVEEKRDHRFILYFLSSFGTTAILVNYVLKLIFARLRPFAELGLSQGICPSTYSFPSGHASSSFAAAVILASYDPKRRYYYYAIASVVSFSRIYLTCHYLSDVIIGACLGCMISGLTLKIKSYIEAKKKNT